MSVGARIPRETVHRAVRITIVASLALVTACASFGGIVRTRSNVVGGVITEDEMRMTVDTVVRNACEEMGTDQQVTRGVVAVRLPPRFRDKAQQVYTPRYDMAVRYTCVRDAYGITGRAAVSL